MNIAMDFDPSGLLRQLPKYEKATVYGAANATTKTTGRVAEALEQRVDDRFVVRRRTFMFGSPGRLGDGFVARVTWPSPSKGRLHAEIAIGETSKGGPFLLSRFERGGVKRPSTPGAKSVAVPVTGRPARPSIARGIDPRFTFAGMKLTQFRGKKKLTRRRKGRTVDEGLLGEFGRPNLPTTGGAVQWKGQNRTFLLPKTKKDPRGAVFQRFGPERGDIRTIWDFIEPPPIPADLHYVDTARRVAERWYRHDMDDAITKELTLVRRSA